MTTGPMSVFVIELAEQGVFAFEAETSAGAEILVQQSHFRRALDDFCTGRRLKREDRPLLPRRATSAEAATYAERISEYPEALGSVLVAQLYDR